MNQKIKKQGEPDKDTDTTQVGTDSEAEALLKKAKRVANEAKEEEAKERARRKRYREPVIGCCINPYRRRSL